MPINLLEVHPEQMHRARPTAEARQLRVFADIVRRDRGSEGDAQGRFKQRACQELAWIYHMVDFQSPYFNVPENQREISVTRDIFGEGTDWKPDDLVMQGLDLYRELSTTPTMRLLDAAYAAVGQLETYFKDVDFNSVSEGRPTYQAKDVIAALEKLSKLVDGISELKKQVEKEKQSSSETWGGLELNEFNR